MSESMLLAIINKMPDFNTIPGFFFYSLSVYSFVIFLSWLAQPMLDESVKEEIE